MLKFAGVPALHDLTATAAIQWMPPAGLEALSLFGALILVAAVSTMGIIFLRKRRRARSSRHHHSRQVAKTGSFEPEKQRFPSSSQGKRRRRRQHRSRNPTLAEIGGLPPLRQVDPPPSPPQN